MKKTLAGVLLVLGMAGAYAQDTLTVVSYNLLNYSSGNSSRDSYFRTVLSYMHPDVLAVDEITTQSDVDAFYSRVLNVVYPGEYAKGTFVSRSGDTNQEIYYRSDKVSFVRNRPITTDLRDINEFVLYSSVAKDTLRLYALHLKASSGSSNESRRSSEVDNLRTVTNLLPTGSFFMTMGDFNIYKSSESAYQKLIQVNSTDDGAFYDAFSLSGTWNSESYARYHTQSTRTGSLSDGGASGGMNDRFDMILYSRAMMQSDALVSFLSGTMHAVGNDGLHYQQSINLLPNYAVPDSVADALYSASDHLPVLTQVVVRPAVQTYTIAATSDSTSTITPSGEISVQAGSRQVFSFGALSGCRIDSVIVDSVRVDSLSEYTFGAIAANHSIHVASHRLPSTVTSIALTAGWNLVSLPRSVIDSTGSFVFPRAVVGTLNGFLSGVYSQPSFMSRGEGYWLFSGSADTAVVTGGAVTGYSLTVGSGNRWVLIGSLSDDVAATSLQTTPSGAIVPGTLIGWDGSGYYAPTTLTAGAGYWIFVNAPCTVVLGSQ